MKDVKIKTWWDLRHGSTNVLEVYAMVVSDAMGYRENASNKKDFTFQERKVQEAVANKLYQVAAALECTEEVNPSNVKATPQEVAA